MSPYRPSMNFFNEWLASLRENDEIPIHYQEGTESPPFLHHGTYRDYEWVLKIDDKLILCYSEGISPSDVRDPIEVETHERSLNSANETICIGNKDINGFYFSIDIRYCKFVEWDEDTEMWKTVDPEEDGPSATQVFLEYFGVDQFFRDWKPPTLEDVVRQDWARRREREIRRSNRNIAQIKQTIENQIASINSLRTTLLKEKANLSEWGHLTLENFMSAIELYKDQLSIVGNDIQISNGFVSVNIEPFTIQGIELGPFNIKYELATSRIMVTPLTGAESSSNEHFHPHVNRDGSVCWGNNNDIIESALRNPFEALFLTVEFLKTGYYREGAYAPLSSWRSSPSWYCNGCEEYHDDGQLCPNECGECNQNVNWDTHFFCDTHLECYEEGERCASCVRDEEERKAELERKKKEAEEKARAAENEEEDSSEERPRKKKKKSSKKKITKRKKKKSSKKKASKKKAKKKVSKRTSRRSVPARAA